jgi:geranylgeranyl reductase family protein
MSQPYDAVVIGAGPAGSCCAYYLAARNLKVLLLDRASLPRHKTCGGAVPRTVLESYPFFSDLSESCNPLSLRKVAYSFRGTRFCERATKDIKVFSIERAGFDHHITLHAAESGCAVEDETAVRSLEERTDHVTITTKNGAIIKTRFAVLACGAHSVLTRSLKQKLGDRKNGSTLASASLLVISPPGALMEHYSGKVHIDFSFIPGGYAGIIPKKGSLALCLYHKKLSAKGYLERKTREFKSLMRIEGEALPLESEVFEVYDDHSLLNTARILLIGDAGALVDPLSGEGIRHALKSASIAAHSVGRCIHEGGSTDEYARQVKAEIGRELHIAGHFAWIAHAFPAVTYGGLVNVSEEAGDVLNGNLSYGALLDRLKRRIWRKLGKVFTPPVAKI